MHIRILIALLFSHYICDYSHLSTSSMLQAKRSGYPFAPIFLHAFVHTCGVATVLAFCHLTNTMLLSLILLELLSHFTIDVLKGRCNVWFPSVANPVNKQHWYIFGFDQFLHQLVLVIIFYFAS